MFLNCGLFHIEFVGVCEHAVYAYPFLSVLRETKFHHFIIFIIFLIRITIIINYHFKAGEGEQHVRKMWPLQPEGQSTHDRKNTLPKQITVCTAVGINRRL